MPKNFSRDRHILILRAAKLHIFPPKIFSHTSFRILKVSGASVAAAIHVWASVGLLLLNAGSGNLRLDGYSRMLWYLYTVLWKSLNLNKQIQALLDNMLISCAQCFLFRKFITLRIKSQMLTKMFIAEFTVNIHKIWTSITPESRSILVVRPKFRSLLLWSMDWSGQ